MKRITNLVLIALLGQAGAAYAETSALKEWTVMVFMNGKNSLSGQVAGDINEMQSVGSGPDLNVVVEAANFGWQDAAGNYESRRYLINKAAKPGLASQLLQTSHADMGDWRNVADFAAFVKKNYPAKRYMLVLWSHGTSWYPVDKPLVRTSKSILADDVTHNEVTVTELGAMLAGIKGTLGRKVDVLLTDACFMQDLAVAYQLRDSADIIAGAEERTPGKGHDYSALLGALAAQPGMSNEDLGRKIVETFTAFYRRYPQDYLSSGMDGTTISAVKGGALPALAKQLDEFAALALKADKAELKSACKAAEGFGGDKFVVARDLRHFMSLVPKFVSDEPVKAKSAEVLGFLDKNVIVGNGLNGSFSNSGGLAVYLCTGVRYMSDFELTDFGSDTRWGELYRFTSDK